MVTRGPGLVAPSHPLTPGRTNLNSPDWQDDFLLAGLVFGLRERGLSPSPHQVYGFAPHPAIRGEVDLDQAIVLYLVVWHAICAQTVGEPR